MGNQISQRLRQFAKKEVRIVCLGLDAAGKTTMLYQIKLGEIVTTIPTIGMNVESMEYKKLGITTWDIGGRSSIRPLWRHYFQNTDAIIYVVDSNDRERISEAENELRRLVSEDMLRDAAWLVFANKQDLPNAASVAEISDKLGLATKLNGKKWFIQASCMNTKDGLKEGLDWLVDTLALSESEKYRLTAKAKVEPNEQNKEKSSSESSVWKTVSKYFSTAA
eukprot:TRINITY_DN531_c0_g1_i2.p1 TRINITY_DN531_c0_g1~~TRINITY_DN531_c0_g1_i2.p1  ORF type:complete len:222 (+),score=36.12 TRINITY_DN531_c0_g1_i2:182-847(+)